MDAATLKEKNKTEPQHNKTNKISGADDADQPAHPHTPIRVFAVCS